MMRPRKPAGFIAAMAFACSASVARADVLPSPTIGNFRSDLENFDVLGTRELSGSMADYMDAQGAIELTNSEFDYAIMGPGFFMLRSRADGSAYYSRCGKFSRRGDVFYADSGDEVIVDPADFARLCDSDATVARITLYYPDDGQEIRVIDERRWSSGTECKKLEGTVVVHALEQNPVDLGDLLGDLRAELRTVSTVDRAVCDRDARATCLELIEGIQRDLEAAGRGYGVDAELASRFRRLAFELAAFDLPGR